MISEIVKICGLSKSEILKRLSAFKDGGVEFAVEEDCLDAKITMTTPRANKDFEKIKCGVYNAFEKEVYSAADVNLIDLVGHFLKTSGRTLGVAESLTGGEICSRIAGIAGISKNFYEGIVCYNSDSKRYRLGVSEKTLAEHGAISRQTA
ncbi:MAG: CinA family protein, partial [[Eubacterium] siraeum]|nr:CinA family protein [[Eubacterium] siraeum]